MNKIFKYLIGIGAIFTIGINLCNAVQVINWNTISWGTSDKADKTIQGQTGYNICINFGANNALEGLRYDYNGQTNQQFIYQNNSDPYRNLQCFTGNGNMTLHKSASSTYILYYWYIPETTCPTCEICQECEEQYTSLECQQEYNLIPLSSVTASYCELNFNLIDPASCPINEGTGVVNWSSLFINNTQYAGNDNIEIFIPDFIGWSIIYNSGTNYIDIEGYNADEDYINNIIDTENMQPTNDDFAYLMQGLQVYAPYLFLFLLFVFAIWLVNKLFHHK